MRTKRITPFVLIASALLVQSAIPASAQEDPGTMERLRLLEILRNAKPAPNPQPEEVFTLQTTASAAHRATVEFDPATGIETVLPAAEIGVEDLLSEDRPAAGVAVGFEDPEPGPAGTKSTTPTPPTPHSNNTYVPWNTIDKLLIRFNVGGSDYYYVCSAWAAGSFHVVTAGHCIYNWDPNGDGNTGDADWADEVWIWAGQGDSVEPVGVSGVDPDRPYGVAKAILLRSYTGWTQDHNYFHDWGVITLDRRDGDHTGWMGRESSCASSLNFSGYPAETPYVPSGTVVQYSGYDANNVDLCGIYRIYLDAYIYGGHSGGPSWRYESETGDRYVEGIHSTSNRTGSATDTRLTGGKLSDLTSYMSTDESARPPVARPDLIEYYFDGNNRKDLLTNTVAQGEDIQVEYNLLNSGFASSGTFTVTFYLSTNRVISTGDYPIGTRNLSLTSWSYTNPTTTLTVPISVPAGTYYLGWIASGGVAEYSTANNSAVIGDETLTVTSGRSLTVTSPNGGEAWRVGDLETVTWTSVDAGSTVKIELSRNNGASWSALTASTLNDGSYQWTANLPTSTSCLVRVVSNAYPTVSDTSDNSFTITTSCGSPEDVVLSRQTVTGTLAVTACNSITAGYDFVIAHGGAAAFTAGNIIVLENGFSVAPGGSFSAALDHGLAPP
jgi:V8-like Glu-specific endopeptidase